MKPVWAIAAMTIRAAVRSRVVVVLIGLLLLGMVGLPLTIKGDGTIAGQVRILLDYTLSSVSVILAIATVWAGCAAISQEIQAHYIHLMVTKPVYRAQIWLGKWLGLLALNAALLAVAGGGIYAALRWTTRPAVLTAAQQQTLREEILVARRQVLPVPIDVDQVVRQEIDQRKASGQMPEGIPPAQVYEAMKQAALAQAFTVPTGYKRRWIFQLPAGLMAGQPLLFRYQLAAAQLGDVAVRGVWLVGPADGTERHEVRQTSQAGAPQSFTIPAAVAGQSRTLAVEYANINPVPMPVLFSPEDGLELLVPAGGFAANFGRSLLVIFCQLAFLGAIAVTAGALVSLPVAALLTGYLVLLMHIGGSLQALAGTQGPLVESPGWSSGPMPVIDTVVRVLMKVQSVVVQPLQAPNPLEYLAVGRLVGWGWVGAAVVIKVIVYSGVLALVGTWLFNRREIGLPG